MISEKIKCIIIDDEVDIRERLESLLSKIDGIEIISKEGIPEKAIEKVIELKPDIVFIDIEMPRMNGFDVINKIREQFCYPTFIFVTAYNQYAIKAIKKEAFDFLLKPVDIEELSQTIERYSKQHNKKDLTKNHHVFDCLSEREKEVLNLLLQGLTSKKIAKKLFISKATIDTHRRNILDKTGMKSTAELMALK
ncbi:MAG: response regulator transcription factor [Bacteroidales bacterium]|nr:response regulator transcription factor [Bacteroidales bacterium]